MFCLRLYWATCRISLSTKNYLSANDKCTYVCSGIMGSTIYYYRRTALSMFFGLIFGRKRKERSAKRRDAFHLLNLRRRYVCRYLRMSQRFFFLVALIKLYFSILVLGGENRTRSTEKQLWFHGFAACGGINNPLSSI